MRIPKLLVLSTLAAALWAGPAAAVDAPHDGSFATGSCDGCHKLHSGGGALTKWASNNLACSDCHATSEPAVPGNRFAMPWSDADQATPGTSGVHHKWGTAAVNATYGTVVPPTPMATYIDAGNLQCATCHDPHTNNKANAATRQVSIRTTDVLPLQGVAPSAGAGGTAPVLFLTVAPGTAATARGYRVVVTSASGSSFRIVISSDFGKTTPTWLKWNGTSWVAATGVTDATGSLMNYTTTYNLNDGTNTQVKFGGTLAATLEWKFYVSYPFLRVSNVADANGMCVQCHGNRNMSHTCVDGTACTADGVKVFSHPVGDALGANAALGDATPATMLDADGSAQAGGSDSNKTNDMVLGTGGVVGCLSCHAPHNTDSNSLTVDAR